jgi:hypothetical protein
MKNAIVFFLAFVLLTTGVYEVFRQKRKTRVIEEILSFVLLVKNEIRYRAPDIETLLKIAQKQNYSYMYFKDGKVTLYENCDGRVKSEFLNFFNRLGTTDTTGQISLCDEFSSLFNKLLEERKENEKSKIQVNTALSVLSALCVIIFSL